MDTARTGALRLRAAAPRAASAALGARVAKALGVPSSSVLSSDGFGTIADVVVIIGAFR